MVAGEVEAVHVQAFHKGHERQGIARLRQQTLQLVDRDHHDRIVPADGDALRPFGAGASDQLAEARLGVLELPAGVTRAGRGFAQLGRDTVSRDYLTRSSQITHRGTTECLRTV